jgi:hypothetical protein
MENGSNTILYIAFYRIPDEFTDIKCRLEKTEIVSRDLRMLKIGHADSFGTLLERVRHYQSQICCYDVHYIAVEVQGDIAQFVETALLANHRNRHIQGEWIRKCV